MKLVIFSQNDLVKILKLLLIKIILEMYQKQKFINQFSNQENKAYLNLKIADYFDIKLIFYEINKREKQIIIKNNETHILDVPVTKVDAIYILQ